MNIKGGCYCSEIRYESKGEVQASIQCHCRECQYITGGNPNVIVIKYCLSPFKKYDNNLQPLPRATGSTPVAKGSKVPP